MTTISSAHHAFNQKQFKLLVLGFSKIFVLLSTYGVTRVLVLRHSHTFFGNFFF